MKTIKYRILNTTREKNYKELIDRLTILGLSPKRTKVLNILDRAIEITIPANYEVEDILALGSLMGQIECS